MGVKGLNTMFENFFPLFNSMMVPYMGPCVLFAPAPLGPGLFFCLLCSLKSCSCCIFYFSIDIVYCISTAWVIPNKAVKKIVTLSNILYGTTVKLEKIHQTIRDFLGFPSSLYSYDPNQYWYSKRKLVASDSQGQKG